MELCVRKGVDISYHHHNLPIFLLHTYGVDHTLLLTAHMYSMLVAVSLLAVSEGYNSSYW
jgi:hypothetical protein